MITPDDASDAIEISVPVGTGSGDVVAGDHDHDGRYYTKPELDAGQLDNRYYLESEVDTMLAAQDALEKMADVWIDSPDYGALLRVDDATGALMWSMDRPRRPRK